MVGIVSTVLFPLESLGLLHFLSVAVARFVTATKKVQSVRSRYVLHPLYASTYVRACAVDHSRHTGL